MYNENTSYQLIIVSNANHEVLKNLAFILYALDDKLQNLFIWR